MRPPEPLRGPTPATVEDIAALNRLFAEAFTDRYHRDGMTGVRVPHLSEAVWRFALADAGEGAMLWHDRDGLLAAFNIAHLAGTEGWMGPLCVAPAWQNAGIGRRIVEAGIAWLRSHGARTIGLETMPRTMDNIGFYSRLGFVPGHLTVTLVKDLHAGRERESGGLLLSCAGPGRAAWLRQCATLTGRLAPGVDYTRAVELTAELGLGDALLWHEGAEVAGFALWHAVPLAHGRPADEARLLKLAAASPAAARAVLRAVEAVVAEQPQLARLVVRCQTAFAGIYAALIADGYRVQWTDLRMTLADAPERLVPPAVVWSNWEI
jgi:GNAT superfamily N-acetyltransferase